MKPKIRQLVNSTAFAKLPLELRRDKLLTATFATVTGNDIVIAHAYIELTPSNDVVVDAGIDPLKGNFVTASEKANSAGTELHAQATPRAKAAAWVLSMLNKAKTVPEMADATRIFTELTGQWYPEWVGGPTDQVQLDKFGIKWLSLKPNCPNN